MDFCLLCVVR